MKIKHPIRALITGAVLFTSMSTVLLLTTECKKDPGRLYPYGWSRIDAVYDSLTLAIEKAFSDIREDTVIENLLYDLRQSANQDPLNKEKRSRNKYWEARYKLRHSEIEKAMEEFKVALAMTDSSKNPYDIARIRWNMDLDEPAGVDGYFETLDKLRLFKEFNDLPMQAAYYMSLGGLMNDIGNPRTALSYFNTADSLLILSDLKGNAARNVINKSRSLEIMGKEQEAAALLRTALKDSLFCRERIAVNIAEWNLYLYTDSIEWLLKAYAGLGGDLNESEYRPLYGSHLIKEYARRGEKDSILKMMKIVDADTANLSKLHLRDYWLARAEGLAAIGDFEGSNEAYSKGVDVISQLAADETAASVTDIENRRAIDAAVHKHELKQRHKTVWLLVSLFAILISFGTFIIIYRRRLARQKEMQLKASLEREQSQKRVIALELAMEENRILGDKLRTTVENLEKQGLVNSKASSALEATFRTHDLTRPAQESFVETFSEVNPRFLNALDTKYPGLSKAERKLASYIVLGLDSKHISRVAGIRPESVKQARWRLRQKLNLPVGITLEEEMRNLASK